MLEKIKKDTMRIFKEIGFDITIEVVLAKCNFLDISLNISRNEYKSYRKENLDIKYIDRNFNHPIIIKKNGTKRINALCKNEEIFNNSVIDYQKA